MPASCAHLPLDGDEVGDDLEGVRPLSAWRVRPARESGSGCCRCGRPAGCARARPRPPTAVQVRVRAMACRSRSESGTPAASALAFQAANSAADARTCRLSRCGGQRIGASPGTEAAATARRSVPRAPQGRGKPGVRRGSAASPRQPQCTDIGYAGSSAVDHHHDPFPGGGSLRRRLLISDLPCDSGSSGAAGFSEPVLVSRRRSRSRTRRRRGPARHAGSRLGRRGGPRRCGPPAS